MRLQTVGSFKDHNGTMVPYRLEPRVDEFDRVRWHCLIAPHVVGEWNDAGSGKNHADAMNAARAYWKQYDTAL